MIEEAISKIEDMSNEATRLQRLDIKDDRTAYYDQRGNILKELLPFPARKHTVRTIESFAAAVGRYGKNATVWVELTGAKCVLADDDDNHRCDVVTFPATPSECFGVLQRQQWQNQPDMVDVLRHELCGAQIDPDNTLALLRNLKFATASEQTGVLTNTSAKMGKSVEASVTGESALPEAVSVEFHPYPSLSDEIDAAVVVWCTLFTNPAAGKLWLCPRLGELEKAKNEATRILRSKIDESLECPVFIGTP